MASDLYWTSLLTFTVLKMKDPIPLKNEEILENISQAILDCCHGFEMPEHAVEEFKKFPLPARFLAMGILLDSLSEMQKRKEPENSKLNRNKALDSFMICKLLLGKWDDSLAGDYFDYWAQRTSEWMRSLLPKEKCH